MTSGDCFSMYKDFKNRDSWESKKEEYSTAWRNLTHYYPDAFNSGDKSEESLLLLSNMGAIKERLEKATQRKEEIISQRVQDYTKSQASNLHNLIAQLLQDLEEEKKRIKNADISAIKEQIETYEKLSGKIETGFRDAYEEFIFHFIKNIRDGLDETLKNAIRTARVGVRKEEQEEHYTERVKEGIFRSLIRGFFWWAGGAGYDEVEHTRAVIKAGAVVDFLTEMHGICEKALNDSVGSFKIVFKKDLYAKVLPVLRQIINDDSLIDERAFKKSVNAVMDEIEFREFEYAGIPSEIGEKTGFLKGDEALQFIQSVENYVRGFGARTKNDVKGYISSLSKGLGKQNFANGVLSKLQKDMQDLKKQVENKKQSIAQIGAQIKALKEI
ncbi:hypothetical protein ID0007_10180 [Helicobacter pylori]